MLSRVAQRVYWMSRYLERVENAARLVTVYSELLLDLPKEVALDWSVALNILGMDEAYRVAGPDEDKLSFLLTSENNIASVLSSLNFARENARTTRDIVPSEAWRAINELHLFAMDKLHLVADGPNAQVPDEIVGRCHEITGILEGTMSHGPAYQFVRLGRSLERADMTSRIIDVAAAIMMSGRDELSLHDSTIWRAVLRALSGYQMYRQYVRRRILGPDVIAFLLRDSDFPRSVVHCVAVLKQALQTLPRCDDALIQLGALSDHLARIDLQNVDNAAVHQFIDELELELAALHGVIFETWLNPMRAA
jgi:uncharacterized alpha-E superfamily protein